MMSTTQIRWGGLAAMAGGALGILCSPIYALAYFATRDGASMLKEPWVAAWAGAVRPVLEPFLTFAQPQDVYLTYGKLLTFVWLGWMAGLLSLHALQSASAGRRETWGFRLAFVGTVLVIVGSIGVYWLGSIWWAASSYFFFAFMVPALLLFNVGFLLFGAGTLRAKVAPRLGAWLLTVGGFPGIILLTLLFGQIAPSLMLINLAWVVLGYALFSKASARAKRPAHVA